MPQVVQNGQPIAELPYSMEEFQQFVQSPQGQQIMQMLSSGQVQLLHEGQPMGPQQYMAMIQQQSNTPGAVGGDQPGALSAIQQIAGDQSGNTRGLSAAPMSQVGGQQMTQAGNAMPYTPGQQPTATQANQRGMYGQ